MKLRLALGWQRFFGPAGYPFSLDLVESRDDTDSQVAFLVDLLPAPPARICDLGSGVGRHAKRLARRGYLVAGVDRFPRGDNEYFAIASSLDQIPVPDATFDSCICMYSSAGYGSRTALARQLGEWARVTRVGGMLILDLANREARIRSAREFFPGGAGRMLSVRVASWRTQLNVAVVAGSITVYAFGYPELRCSDMTRCLRETGWKTLDAFGDFDGSAFSPRSKRLILKAVRC